MSRLYSPENKPHKNLEILAANPYPGRFIVIGKAGGVAVQAYAIMGRSEGSRNRVLVEQDGIVSTDVFDKSQPVGDPSLTIYEAVRQEGAVHIVSNGRQTTTAAEHLRDGKTFQDAMETHTYEPDDPNFTPRISGFIDTEADLHDRPAIGISIIRKIAVSNLPVRDLFTDYFPDHNLGSGIGMAVHTYKGDGSPLPTFDEAPFRMPVEDTAEGMAQLLWDNLNEENRVAVAAKVIAPTGQDIFIINRHG